MRFLIDECLPQSLAIELRSRGHDVTSARHVCAGDEDADVLGRATTELRLVITEDRDYGALVFLHRQPAVGIVLVQLNEFVGPLLETVSRIAVVIHAMSDRLEGNFTVIEPGQVRQRPLAWRQSRTPE